MGYGLYSGMTDQALIDEIQEYRAAIKKTNLNNVAVIQGEGRRLEFTRANIGDVRTELRNLLTEAARRGLEIGAGSGTGLAVEIG